MSRDLETIPPNWKMDYQCHLQGLTLSRLRVVAVVVVLFVLLDGGVQLHLMTDLFTKLLSVRIAAAFLIMLLFGLSYVRSASRFAFPLSLIGAFIVAGDVEAAIVVTGGYHSPFQTGLTLLVIGVGLFFPYSPAQMSIAYVIFWVVYLVAIIVGRETIDIAVSGRDLGNSLRGTEYIKRLLSSVFRCEKRHRILLTGEDL